MGSPRTRTTDGRRPRRRPTALSWGIVAVALAAVLVTLGATLADVVLQYQATTKASGAPSPFKFVNGGNYAQAHTLGLFTTTYPNAQQVSVATSPSGASGAYGSYLLDVLEVQANATSATGWHLRVDVSTALVATGLNAAYVFYCTTVPTGVPDTGAPLASGTDSHGNPWAIFAPTCAGTEVSLSMTATGTGTAIAFASLTAGTMLLSVGFGLAITNTGAATTTAGVMTVVAVSP